MSGRTSDPIRWRDREGACDRAERSAGAAVRLIDEPPPLSPDAWTRLSLEIRGGRPRHQTRVAYLAAAFLIGVTTAASAARLDLVPTWLTRALPPEAPKMAPRRAIGAPRAALHPRTSTPGGPEQAVAESPTPRPPSAAETPSRDPSGAAMALSRARLRREQRPSAPDGPTVRGLEATAVPAAGQPSDGPSLQADRSDSAVRRLEPVAGEAPAWTQRPAAAAPPPPSRPALSGANFLTAAIRALRVDRAPAACLAILDGYGPTISARGLAYEATILRVEALLALGREGEALKLLDGSALAAATASKGLLLTRARLRAAANRCPEALEDFDAVLGQAADRDALAGRALCRKRTGDYAGARQDLERYKALYPVDGRLSALEREMGAAP